MDWYLGYNGQQIGPMDIEQARSHAKRDSNGFAWCPGMVDWKPISEMPELVSGPPAHMIPPNPPSFRTNRADEIDYKVFGSEMQFVEIELDPGESVIAEAGAMMYKDSLIEMNTIFGDGSDQKGQGGFMDKLMGPENGS